ncbi:gas vesicle protein GvpH [Haloarcula amylovorans]|uniref:gas vesicle protein GvpH n=1 Tax=Haloarcula amylovorans TaxID=2562280 RepID=UPI001075FE11|nr:gas vesicle protein GvpH [Halomicroarcula amylolytica]
MTSGDNSGSDDWDGDSTDTDGKGIHIEFGISLSDLVDGILDGDHTSDDRGSLGHRPERSGTEQSSPDSDEIDRQELDESAVDSHVRTYRDGDQLTVVADLPDTDFDDVSAAVGERTNDLVVLVDEAVVDRVSLPWEVFEVDAATFNNGVLEIRVHAVGDSVS